MCDERFASAEDLEEHRGKHGQEIKLTEFENLISHAKVWTSKWPKSRTIIYLNEPKVERLYKHYISPIVELNFGTERSHEIEGKLQALVATLGGKQGWKETKNAKSMISPELMVVILEYYVERNDKLVDPNFGPPDDEKWFRHVGDCHFTYHDADVKTVSNKILPLNLQMLLQRKRLEEQNHLSTNTKKAETMVVAWEKGDRYLASIANIEWVDRSSYGRYGYPPIGIFGRFQQQIDGILLIDPLSIWHEMVQTQSAYHLATLN